MGGGGEGRSGFACVIAGEHPKTRRAHGRGDGVCGYQATRNDQRVPCASHKSLLSCVHARPRDSFK